MEESPQIAGNLNQGLQSYNTAVLNLVWSNKIKLVVFIIFTSVGFYSIPYLDNLQKKLGKKAEHKNQMLYVKQLKEKKGMFDVILDVRSKEEYEQGHVANSIHIDYKDLLKDKSKLKQNKITKEDIILIYCKRGNRASIVANKLVKDYHYDKTKLFLTTESYKEINKVLL